MCRFDRHSEGGRILQPRSQRAYLNRTSHDRITVGRSLQSRHERARGARKYKKGVNDRPHRHGLRDSPEKAESLVSSRLLHTGSGSLPPRALPCAPPSSAHANLKSRAVRRGRSALHARGGGKGKRVTVSVALNKACLTGHSLTCYASTPPYSSLSSASTSPAAAPPQAGGAGTASRCLSSPSAKDVVISGLPVAQRRTRRQRRARQHPPCGGHRAANRWTKYTLRKSTEATSENVCKRGPRHHAPNRIARKPASGRYRSGLQSSREREGRGAQRHEQGRWAGVRLHTSSPPARRMFDSDSA